MSIRITKPTNFTGQYYQNEIAKLSPSVLAPIQYGNFDTSPTYDAERLIIAASFNTALFNTATTDNRVETRDPRNMIELSAGVNLVGNFANACAMILRPSQAGNSFSDWLALKNTLEGLITYEVSLPIGVASNTQSAFIPGPYGAIVTGVISFRLTWSILMPFAQSAYGMNLMNELGDTAPSDEQRVGNSLQIPVSLGRVAVFKAGLTSDPQAAASLIYKQLPESYENIARPGTELLYEDFWDAIDLTVWDITSTAVGETVREDKFKALKISGSGAWSQNSFALKSAIDGMAEGTVFECFVTPHLTTAFNAINLMVGFTTKLGGALNFSDMAYAIYFTTPGAGVPAIQIFENGVNRGTVGAGYANGATYKVRITIQAGGGCKYEIQGGTEYNSIDSGVWDDITPAGSAGATSGLGAGATVSLQGENYVSKVRVYNP